MSKALVTAPDWEYLVKRYFTEHNIAVDPSRVAASRDGLELVSGVLLQDIVEPSTPTPVKAGNKIADLVSASIQKRALQRVTTAALSIWGPQSARKKEATDLLLSGTLLIVFGGDTSHATVERVNEAISLYRQGAEEGGELPMTWLDNFDNVLPR